MHDTSHFQNELNRVLEKIQEIVEKSAGGDYIYRGEPERYQEFPYHGKVSSSLYRSLLIDSIVEEGIEEYCKVIEPNIPDMEREILGLAKEYLYGTASETPDDFEILARHQHYGGKTNFIDFTTDYLIALFFACDRSYHKDGRVILQKRESGDYQSKIPPETIKRVESQKSILLQSPKGFITPDVEVIIPKELKLSILNYLEKHHDISTKRIYKDIHGFIKWLDGYFDPMLEFGKGVICQNRASLGNNMQEKLKWYEKAYEHFTEALKLKSDFTEVYIHRGVVFRDVDRFDPALKDFNSAIEIDPESANAYDDRGVCYAEMGDTEKALNDFNKAIDLNPKSAKSYNSRGITYKDMGKIDLAMKDYNKAIELDPEFPEVYNNLGIIYDEKGEHDCAIKNYTKAIELKSYYVSAYNNRGRAYRVKGNIELAIEDFKTAIIGESDFAEAYYNLCETYLFKGDLECAYTDLTKLAILLSSPYACFARGIIGLCQQQWKQAIADFTVAEDNGVDIVALFTNGYKSIEDFEETNDIQIPEDIREMLSPQ